MADTRWVANERLGDRQQGQLSLKMDAYPA